MNETIFRTLFSKVVKQSLMNQKTKWKTLPIDQQEVLNEMLRLVHDFAENKKKIKPEYKSQVYDAVILEVAEEMGIIKKRKS